MIWNLSLITWSTPTTRSRRIEPVQHTGRCPNELECNRPSRTCMIRVELLLRLTVSIRRSLSNYLSSSHSSVAQLLIIHIVDVSGRSREHVCHDREAVDRLDDVACAFVNDFRASEVTLQCRQRTTPTTCKVHFMFDRRGRARNRRKTVRRVASHLLRLILEFLYSRLLAYFCFLAII